MNISRSTGPKSARTLSTTSGAYAQPNVAFSLASGVLRGSAGS
jgi:hypothetical protein